jgi:hypothetical protein
MLNEAGLKLVRLKFVSYFTNLRAYSKRPPLRADADKTSLKDLKKQNKDLDKFNRNANNANFSIRNDSFKDQFNRNDSFKNQFNRNDQNMKRSNKSDKFNNSKAIRPTIEKRDAKNSEILRNDGQTLNVHVVSNGYMNSPKSCVISTDNSHVLVNCGEGCERIVAQNTLKPNKIDQFLFTRFDWSTIGGFQGITTHIAEYSLPNHQVTMHAPVDFHFEDRTKSFKKFFVAKEIRVKQHNYATGGDYDGGDFTMQKIDMTLTPESKSSVWSYFIKFKKVSQFILQP